MSLYLHYKDQQTGPFTEEQVRQMLQSGQISRDALAWRDGMANWIPVLQVIGAAPAGVATATATQPGGKPVLGWISLGYSILSFVGYIILIVGAGLVGSSGNVSQGFESCLGFLLIAGLFLNFVALVFGVVGSFTSRTKVVPILGACFNALILLVCIGALTVTLVFKHQQ